MRYLYLLFGLIIVYLLYCYYLKYEEQENFDPSLVPVSSIVTLAKVAQKLVDGGGTLTNPGNLQIGLPSAGAVGNLYVTGTNTVDGASTFNNTITTGTNQPIIYRGTSNYSIINDSDNLLRIKNNDGTQLLAIGQSGDIYTNGNGLILDTSKNLTIAGNSSVTGNSSTTGTSTVTGSSTLNGETFINNRLHIKGASSTPADAGDLTTHFNHSDGNNYIRGNTYVSGNTNISKDIVVNGTVRFQNTQFGNDTWFPYTDGNNYIRGTTYIDGNISPNKFYLLYARWQSAWQGWQSDFQTFGGIQRTFDAANAAGARTCTWNRLDQNGNGFDPHPNQGKGLTVIYKCGLNGTAKSASFGDGDAVNFSC
jgi:hypothetical protein